MPRRYFTPIKANLVSFHDGLNLGPPDSLGERELSVLMNGFPVGDSIEKRQGSDRIAVTGITAVIVNGMYWEAANMMVYWSNDGKLWTKAGGPTTSGAATLQHTFTTADLVTWVVFNGLLIGVHQVDGVWSLTTAGVWALITNTVKGKSIASWQNKCWVVGDPGNPSRVWWCNLGNAGVWTVASDFVDLREVDDLATVAVGAGQNMDIAGRPSLLVAKRDSCYRINNSVTGAYTTLDSHIGVGNAQCLGSVGNIIGMLHASGLYLTDGVQPPVKVSAKMDPLFTSSTGYATIPYFNIASQPQQGKLIGFRGKFVCLFTCNAAGDTMLMYDLGQKAWSMHDFITGGLGGTSCLWATRVPNSSFGELLYGGYCDFTHFEPRMMFLDGQGTDTKPGVSQFLAVPMKAYTRWLELAGGTKFNARHLRFFGRGPSWTLRPRLDFDERVSDPIARTFTLPNTNFSGQSRVQIADLYSLGKARAIKLCFDQTSSQMFYDANFDASMIGSGYPVGDAAINELHLTAYALGEG